MTINEYQKEALRAASGMSKKYPLILNGVLGLGGEPGECLDIVKEHLSQGHELDTEHLAEELGDVAWLLAVSAHAIGIDLESILQGNAAKLRKWYPDGFDAERSVHRDG
jgi:NTP pyrophosphatase (non-canonical NTP hydrolase)